MPARTLNFNDFGLSITSSTRAANSHKKMSDFDNLYIIIVLFTPAKVIKTHDMNKYMIENTAITPACQELLERVRQAKRLNKLSVETIAKEAGMHRPTVQNQLYGRYNLDIRVVLALARLSPNISCNWLLRGEGSMLMQPQQQADLPIISNDIQVVFENIKSIENSMKSTQKIAKDNQTKLLAIYTNLIVNNT